MIGVLQYSSLINYLLGSLFLGLLRGVRVGLWGAKGLVHPSEEIAILALGAASMRKFWVSFVTSL